MYLKSLVLKGFKSFADRSVLNLEPGITAIVGPNGSGKSNIVDAVLWVLGERNARHLRGQAMEDVIFAGSSVRKPVGIAEVDLVLDNSDGTIAVDFDELVISRRMYRNGESEYLVNGTVVRRMDVLDILHDSGLGTGTHSIISQGSLDSVLQSSPEERRALIEEAAGVLKHKQRREKSERKLASMEANLNRVQDLAAELKRQLGPLERKAKRAITYQSLSQEAAELNLALAVDRLRSLKLEWEEILKKEEALSKELSEKKDSSDRFEQAVSGLQAQIREGSVEEGKVRQDYQRASSVSDRVDSATLLIHEKLRAAQDYEADIRISREESAERLTHAKREKEASQERLNEVSAAMQTAQEKVDALHLQKNEAKNVLEDAESRAQAILERIQEIHDAEDQAKRKRESLQDRISQANAQTHLVQARRMELEGRIDKAQKNLELLQGDLEDKRKAIAQLEASVAHQTDVTQSAAEERDKARTALDTANGDLARLRGERDAEAAKSFEDPALAWLLEHKQDLPVRIDRLVKSLTVPQGMEVLVEHLLGQDSQAVVVDDADGAKTISHSLSLQARGGSVSLIMRHDARTQKTSPVDSDHLLINELTYPEEMKEVVFALLGDVVLCSSRDEAFAAHKTDTKNRRFASLDGCVVWPQGKVSIFGKPKNLDDSVLGHERALKELEASLKEAERRCSRAQDAHQKAEVQASEAQDKLLDLRRTLAQDRGTVESVERQVRSAQDELGQLEKEMAEVEVQTQKMRADLGALKPDLTQIEEEIAKLQSEAQKKAPQQRELEEELKTLRASDNEIGQHLQAAQLELATYSERRAYAARMVETRERDMQNELHQQEQSQENLLRKLVAQKRSRALLKVLEALSQSMSIRISSLDTAVHAAKNSSSGLHEQVDSMRRQAQQARTALDETNSRMSELHVEKGRLELQVESAIRAIEEDCETSLDEAVKLPELSDRHETEERFFKLQRRIKNMGTINPDAAEEYEALKERYTYLDAQLQDLEHARQSLKRIVRVIDARMKDDFVNTFDTVNANFQEIFSLLFPGGSGSLVLDMPDDLENTGVEVQVQPSGKRILKMGLLSGGEKSLTALALLFAVYRTRSTPFYILDEVEAALDDSNLRRLITYLESLRKDTQLIMITHQRRTMEMADVLFGVSMQSDGVTKVVSQRLERALAQAQ
ncbi:MAG: chromosome segregation protein SMC [Eggerthellaceae bacterium]|jgi:chromosome segregation protein